jgi:hypothetical protein
MLPCVFVSIVCGSILAALSLVQIFLENLRIKIVRQSVHAWGLTYPISKNPCTDSKDCLAPDMIFFGNKVFNWIKMLLFLHLFQDFFQLFFSCHGFCMPGIDTGSLFKTGIRFGNFFEIDK